MFVMTKSIPPTPTHAIFYSAEATDFDSKLFAYIGMSWFFSLSLHLSTILSIPPCPFCVSPPPPSIIASQVWLEECSLFSLLVHVSAADNWAMQYSDYFSFPE